MDKLSISLKALESSLKIEQMHLKHLNLSQLTSAITNHISDGALDDFVSGIGDMMEGVKNRGGLINALQNEQMKKITPAGTLNNQFSRQQKINTIKNGRFPWDGDLTEYQTIGDK